MTTGSDTDRDGFVHPTGVDRSVTVTTWSGGLTVTGPSLALCLGAVARHPLASRDTGPLMIHGHRTVAGSASVIVRLDEPRIGYVPVGEAVPHG